MKKVLIMYRVFYPIVYAAVYLLSLLPLKVHYFFSDVMAFLLCRVVRYRRKVVVMNLSRAFPDLKYWEIDGLMRDFYRYLSDLFVETLWSLSAEQKQLDRMLEVRGHDLMDELIAKYGSVIVVMGHQGNWEFTASMCESCLTRSKDSYAEKVKLVPAYKRQSGKITDRLMMAIREHALKTNRMRGDIVESGAYLRHVLKDRSDGEKAIYYMIADQSSPLPKLALEFLNQKTVIFNGPEHIARKTGYPVVFLENVKVAQGRYKVSYRLLAEDPAATEPGYISRTFMKMLETSISSNRSSWLWSHRRWKYTFGREDDKLIFL